MREPLSRLIHQILVASGAATFTIGTWAAVGIQNPPPGPGQVPDYFGVVPNYANSPQPISAMVTIAGSPSGNAANATAAATTYDYVNDAPTSGVADIQVLFGGSGYSADRAQAPLVTITGGTGATGASAFAHVNGLTTILVNNGGSGYTSAPSVSVSAPDDAAGTAATATAIVDIAKGTVTGIQITDAGSGYTQAPTVTLSGGGGSGADVAGKINSTVGAVTSIDVNSKGTGYNNPIVGTGIRKFVDSLSQPNTANNLGQQLPVAVPDTTTFPGADYYVIAETEYAQKMHSDLPATTMRGYKQLNAPAGSAAANNHYLGPVIIAQKNRPVRVRLVNQLPTGAAGKLQIPVDHTYMGANGKTDTDNRTAMHLHGGNTPWISDGTPYQWVKPKGETGSNKGTSVSYVPDMWFDAAGNLIPNSPTCTQGSTTCTTAGATNNPGDGALTFYYTNQQSQRLMFYHDHAEGLTRLNVYDGLAGAYILQDDTEKAMTNGGAVGGQVFTPVLPADMIPLVIQEKTFVPDNTVPRLNFYGPFASQLNSQDPTWRWGTGRAAPALNGTGDLWVPHVYMPNQNPGDPSGANPLGRWDYGPWFWPPYTGIMNGQVANPYYDPSCVPANTVLGTCEGPYIPGIPNGNTVTSTLNEPTGTPEAYNDTPLVNGTVYPYVTVEPKKYRLRILNPGNDRVLNLSLVIAASKNTDTTAVGNAGANNNPAILCDGTTGVNPADCTEVKMVPFDSTQNKAKAFPPHWYTGQKGGVTFDGRPSGVFAPEARGPEMVQIGTEGGFLSSPVEIKNQPINFEYNVKNIVVGNIKEHALLLGPAERADVIVDFSQFAGSTIILYNDAPAAAPAADLRVDYYTGDLDNTDTGGSFSTLPGYGPNTRTIMQFRVGSACSSANCGTGINRAPSNNHPADDVDSGNLASLSGAVQTAFRTSQEPIIVPQAAYNPVYGTNVADTTGGAVSRISDTQLSFTPLQDTSVFPSTMQTAPVTLSMAPKSIIEQFTNDFGRMNALLGVEVPLTTWATQTSIPQAYIDPPTELVKITPNDTATPISGTLNDGTQIWKITHNGVDTHPVHFHLFHVQLINRVGWDGAIRGPEPNELGWKDTVRMNPLEDIIVALRPKTMSLPFKVPNSHRLLNASSSSFKGDLADFFNLDPITGNASNVSNVTTNFGWEYVWHCHILGHEENDFMRTIAVAQPPEKPEATTATGTGANVTVNWTDKSVLSNWVTIQRATDTAFTKDVTSFDVVEPECASQSGCARNYVDKTAPAGSSVYYRVKSNNTVGGGDVNAKLPASVASLTPQLTGYDNVTASSDWSNTVSRLLVPVSSLSPTSLSFSATNLGATSASKTVTLSNTGAGNLSISSIALSNANFTRSGGTCATTFPANLGAGANCTLILNFKPTTAAGALTGTLTVTDNSNNVTGSIKTIALSGTANGAIATVTPSSLTFAAQNVGTPSAAQTVTLTNSGNSSLSITSIAATAPFTKSGGTCGNTLAAGASCTATVTFTPTALGAASGTLTFTDNSAGVNGAKQTASLAGTGQGTVLAAPSGLTASVSGTNVALNWTDASSGETGYVVQRAPVTITNAGAQAVGNYATITSLSADANTLTNNGVAAGLYAYKVYAVNGATNGAAATVYAYNGAALSTPVAPSASTLANRTTNSIKVAWTASTPATNAITGYVVQRCDNSQSYALASPTAAAQSLAMAVCNAPGATWTNLTTTTGGSAGVVNYNNNGLSGKKIYVYRVIAVNALTGAFSANSASTALWTN